MIALLSAAFGVACSAILGVDDLPRLVSADGGDAQIDAPHGGGPGRLDPSFGDRGIATIVVNAPLSDPALIVEGDDIRVLATTTDGDLLLVRCSKDGACDASHPTTIWKGRNIIAFAVKDPSWGDLLVHMSMSAPNYHSVLQLLRLERDGGVEVLRREEFDTNRAVWEHGMVANPSRIVTLQPADLGLDGGRIELRAILPDGGVDPSFGAKGTAVSPTFSQVPLLRRASTERNGGLVALLDDTDRHVLAWLRFHADGGVDTSFGSDGGLGETRALLEGKSLLVDDAGYVIGGARNDARGGLVRVTRDGRIDPSWWNEGIYLFPSHLPDDDPHVIAAEALARGPNESIMVLARARNLMGITLVVLARVGPGGLDRSFGENGLVSVATDVGVTPDGLAMQSDGKALVVWAQADALRLARYIVE